MSRIASLAAGMRWGLAVALALPAAVAPALAQTASTALDVLSHMPNELGGAPVQRLPDGALMYYLKGPSGEPVIVGVMADARDGVLAPGELRSLVRKMAEGQSGLRRIIREGSFTTPKWPGATTFFGDYETGRFSHQNWIVMTGTQAVTVIATYDKKKDSKWAQALVADKIFGGAVIAAREDKPK